MAVGDDEYVYIWISPTHTFLTIVSQVVRKLESS